jgi:hypothetical protein
MGDLLNNVQMLCRVLRVRDNRLYAGGNYRLHRRWGDCLNWSCYNRWWISWGGWFQIIVFGFKHDQRRKDDGGYAKMVWGVCNADSINVAKC